MSSPSVSSPPPAEMRCPASYSATKKKISLGYRPGTHVGTRTLFADCARRNPASSSASFRMHASGSDLSSSPAHASINIPSVKSIHIGREAKLPDQHHRFLRTVIEEHRRAVPPVIRLPILLSAKSHRSAKNQTSSSSGRTNRPITSSPALIRTRSEATDSSPSSHSTAQTSASQHQSATALS